MAKLFIKTTNERGKTATLAGNEFLDIEINVGNVRIASYTLRYSDDIEEAEVLEDGQSPSGWVLYDNNDSAVWWILDEKKGKKQQGKKCIVCGRAKKEKYCSHCGWDTGSE